MATLVQMRLSGKSLRLVATMDGYRLFRSDTQDTCGRSSTVCNWRVGLYGAHDDTTEGLCVRIKGRIWLCIRKRFFARGTLEQDFQAMVMASSWLQFKKHFDNVLKHWV